MTETEVKTDTMKNKSKRSWKITDFNVGKCIGKGRFGSVYIAQEKSSQYVFALKIILKDKIIKGNIEYQLEREIAIQSHLKHKNILNLYGYFYDDKRVYMILEYATKGQLSNQLKQVSKLLENIASKYTYGIINGLNYCHKNGVIHRDIKPENILLNSKNIIKLCDFGCSVHQKDEIKKSRKLCGTIDYLPPEIIKGEKVDYNVDVWSLGITVYELITGNLPFQCNNTMETYKTICNKQITYPDYVSNDAIDFINSLLKKDPKQRISLTDASKHEWITQYNQNE